MTQSDPSPQSSGSGVVRLVPEAKSGPVQSSHNRIPTMLLINMILKTHDKKHTCIIFLPKFMKVPTL